MTQEERSGPVRPAEVGAAGSRLDVRLEGTGREGLTGTAPAALYGTLREREDCTLPPDGRPPEAQPAWRRDFPIDWPQDHYVARRDFAKFLVLTSLAFAVGQYCIAARRWFRRQGRPGSPQRIAPLASLAIPSVAQFTYADAQEPCVLIRTREGLVAYGQKCTHLSCAVVPRPEEGVIHCPCHEGYFDLQTGRPIAGPPRRPLPRVLLEVRGGEVYATGFETRTV